MAREGGAMIEREEGCVEGREEEEDDEDRVAANDVCLTIHEWRRTSDMEIRMVGSDASMRRTRLLASAEMRGQGVRVKSGSARTTESKTALWFLPQKGSTPGQRMGA